MNSRKLAIHVLDSVLNNGAYSNVALNNALRASDLNMKDKALATEIVYGTIKYKQSIDDIISLYVRDISLINKEIINILRSAVYQIKYLDKIPPYAAVNEAVDISKKQSVGASKFVNGVLRNFLRNKDREPVFKDEISKIAFKYSFPKWMVKSFIAQYGEEKTMEILEGLNKTPKVTVRVNALKASFEDVFEELENEGYDISEGYASPDAIIIDRGSSIEENPAFKEGKIIVQDESAMLVAPILDLEENSIAADICAAPGGKSTHMAEIMNNKGKVFSFDLHANKLSRIEDNARRLGIDIIQTEAQDATIFNESLENSFDRILLDVPCSGLGIIRKKPEIKWQKDLKSLKEIQEIQKKILDNTWKYLKNGGIMVYSTCTLNKNENEEIVRYLLTNNKDCEVNKIYIGNLPNFSYNKDGTLTILPNEYMDGFFIAKLTKRQVE
ncbi:MAG: 16S rRNA (cytosine(967)-C(5))-methyltransferase RsmB [Clostridiaceae bacterium]